MRLDFIFVSVLGLVAPGEARLERKDLIKPYIVSFKKSLNINGKIEAFVRTKLNDFPTLQRNSIKLFNTYSKVFNGFSATFPVSMVPLIRAIPGVDNVEEDGAIELYSVQQDAPWGLARIAQRERLAPTGPYSYAYADDAGEGVAVYVIDSGVRIEHEEFEGRASIGKTFEGDNDMDENGHGTHVAATIAGKTYGVAKKAEIIACKVFDGSGKGSFSNTLEAIEYVINDKRGKKANVINMSLGGIRSFSINRAVEAAYKAGITVVVAAGNSHADSLFFSPASSFHAITVGATTINDTLAKFSNFGLMVDILAPGQDITSAWNDSNMGTKTISGTSMASPHVAGLAAYLHSQEQLTNKEVAEKMKKMATRNAIAGTGILNLSAGIGILTANTFAYTGVREALPIDPKTLLPGYKPSYNDYGSGDYTAPVYSGIEPKDDLPSSYEKIPSGEYTPPTYSEIDPKDGLPPSYEKIPSEEYTPPTYSKVNPKDKQTPSYQKIPSEEYTPPTYSKVKPKDKQTPSYEKIPTEEYTPPTYSKVKPKDNQIPSSKKKPSDEYTPSRESKRAGSKKRKEY